MVTYSLPGKKSETTSNSQLDHVFASQGIHENLTVRAINPVDELGASDEHRWVERNDFAEHTIGKLSDRHEEDGRSSRRRRYRRVVREQPSLASAALFHLIGNSIFLRLSAVASGLPPYAGRC